MRQLNELRARLAAAQDAFTGAQAETERAENAYAAADERFAEAEEAVEVARAERAEARQVRYAARQARERASTAVTRLERRVSELSDRLDRMRPLIAAPDRRSPPSQAAGRWQARPARQRAGGKPVQPGKRLGPLNLKNLVCHIFNF